MALSYLNKKNWHPEKFSNIEKVFLAEQDKDDKERKQKDRINKLREEKHIEDLKRMQVEAGIIPASSLQRIEWMYTDRNAQSKDEQTAEEFLMGKPIDKVNEPSHNDPSPSGALNPLEDENEVFARMVNDPLMHIKKMEGSLKEEAACDPVTL